MLFIGQLRGGVRSLLTFVWELFYRLKNAPLRCYISLVLRWHFKDPAYFDSCIATKIQQVCSYHLSVLQLCRVLSNIFCINYMMQYQRQYNCCESTSAYIPSNVFEVGMERCFIGWLFCICGVYP